MIKIEDIIAIAFPLALILGWIIYTLITHKPNVEEDPRDKKIRELEKEFHRIKYD